MLKDRAKLKIEDGRSLFLLEFNNLKDKIYGLINQNLSINGKTLNKCLSKVLGNFLVRIINIVR